MSRNQQIGTNKVPVGATRQAVISGLNITYVWLIPVLAVPLISIWLTRNVFWGGLAFPMLYWARKSNSDPGLPRILYLWVMSGSWQADRSARGTEVVSAVRDANKTEGTLHG